MRQSLAAAAQESNTATHRSISLRVLSKSLILSMLRNCGQFLTYSERKKPHVVWLFPLQSVLIHAAALWPEFSSNNNGGKWSGEDFSTQSVRIFDSEHAQKSRGFLTCGKILSD